MRSRTSGDGRESQGARPPGGHHVPRDRCDVLPGHTPRSLIVFSPRREVGRTPGTTERGSVSHESEGQGASGRDRDRLLRRLVWQRTGPVKKDVCSQQSCSYTGHWGSVSSLSRSGDGLRSVRTPPIRNQLPLDVRNVSQCPMGRPVNPKTRLLSVRYYRRNGV